MRAETIGLDTEVEALLTEAKLPVSDLSSSGSLNLLGIREGSRLVGVVGVEVYRKVGMLRSLAVEQARRNTGLGVSLVSDAETWALEQGVRDLYLLTATAGQFSCQARLRGSPAIRGSGRDCGNGPVLGPVPSLVDIHAQGVDR